MNSSPQQTLILGSVWPEPRSSAAGSRMMQLIRLFLEKGWDITFASVASDSDYAVDLKTMGVDVSQVELNSSGFDLFVRNLDPSIVLFDRFMTEEQFGWRVAEQCPDALRILDTEDLHCLRKSRQKALTEERPFSEKDLLEQEITKREVASILRSDLSLIISEAEMNLLQEVLQLDSTLLYYLPYLLDPIERDQWDSWPSFESRRGFVTIGNFRHPPNKDSVQYLHDEIWYRIRKTLPEAEMSIYGAYPSKQMETFHKPEEGFHIKGRAKDAEEVIGNARVMFAPLRFGAGLKGKLVEAMQCGTPSVTTDIGREGIAGDYDWPGMVGNNPDEIANAAIKLYKDFRLWSIAQENGIELINNRFLKNEHGSAFIRKILERQENLADHRLNNITGSILMHHTTASTKFMSKWIEAKNENQDGQD